MYYVLITIPASVVALMSSASGYRRKVKTLSRNLARSSEVQLIELSIFVHHCFGYQSYMIQAYLGYVRFLFIACEGIMNKSTVNNPTGFCNSFIVSYFVRYTGCSTRTALKLSMIDYIYSYNQVSATVIIFV